MTTQLLLRTGTDGWERVAESVTGAVTDLIDGDVSSFSVSMPHSGQRVDGHRLGDGELRLSAAGNDSLPSAQRLTVRDERAVIAVGFSVASAGWGTFVWDWSAPVDPGAVASGIVRTMRDIYKADPADVEVLVTL